MGLVYNHTHNKTKSYIIWNGILFLGGGGGDLCRKNTRPLFKLYFMGEKKQVNITNFVSRILLRELASAPDATLDCAFNIP